MPNDVDRQHGLFIPSQLLTAEFWAPLIDGLADRIDATVADHRGHDSVAAIAQSALAEAPDEFVLFAHGMGGFIAFEILRQQPGRVRKLVLFSSLASADVPTQTARRMNYLRLVEAGDFAAVVEERIPILVHPDRRSDAALIGLIRKMAADTGAEAFLRQQRAIMGRIDSRPALGAIACPTLLIFGEQDGITAMAHQHEMIAAIPEAQLELIRDCGHMVPLERPDAVLSLLSDWL